MLAYTHCNVCASNALLIATIAQQLCQMANRVAVLLNSDCDRPSEEGAICFGRYRIESPKMGLQLVYNVVRLHLTDLQTLLETIKERIGPKRVACERLGFAEDEVVKVCWMIQQLPN